MADSRLGPRWRHLARVLRGEKAITAAALRALQEILGYADRALRSSGYDPSVLSAAAAGWPKVLRDVIVPEIEDVFREAFAATSRGGLDPQDFGTRHIEAATNRLAGVPDEVFDAMRLAIETGRREQESIPEIAARVDSLLTDQERWHNRAVTIARTETIGANNAGSWAAAGGVAAALDVDGDLVVKEWLATSDGRTRPTHADADGQQVRGMTTPFSVGGADLQFAGDQDGPPEEVINCRCTVLYLMPGDPDYPDDLNPGGTSTGNSPIPADPVAAPETASTQAATPTEVAPPPEPVVDAGPQNDMERMARSLTLGELVMETKRGSARARSVARAELARRGITAAAGDQPNEEDDVAEVESENRNGVVLVALPAADDPCQEIGPEDKHATLLYFGDLPDSDGDNPNPGLTDDFRTLLSQAAAVVANGYASGDFTAPVEGVEPLGDEGARVWMLGGDDLAFIRSEVQDVDTEIGTVLNAVDQYPTYTPHVTIGYVTGDDLPGTDEAEETGQVSDDALDQATTITEIRFDRLALWWGTDRTEWPLQGGTDTQEDDMPETDTPEAVAAAAGDPVPDTTPLAAGDPAPAVDGSTAESDQFHGTMMVEDTQTGDGRAFAAGSVEWEGLLPMPLGWQVEDAPGHDGSVIVGRIDSITRVGNEIQYEGTWDLDGYGWEPRRMVEGQFLRGLSVDVDDVEAQVVAEDGTEADAFDLFMMDEGVLVVTRGRIRSAALCRVPAFAPLDSPGSVFIANGPRPTAAPETPADEAPAEETPAPDDAAVTAALVAAATRADLPAARSLPPADWFSSPNLDGPTPVTVTDDGRVYGHLAAWGTCHIGIQGQCVTPPESLAAYAYFLTGETETTAGFVPTGSLTMDTGHAPLSLRAGAAAAHYDNTGTAFADVAVGEDEHGIWFSGALRASVTPDKVEVIRAAGALSGDWRRIGAGLELVAALAVNVPGFPLPRLAVAASASRQTALVASGVVPRTIPVDANELGAVVAAAVRRALRVERATAAYDETARRARARRVERAATLIERNR